MDKELLINKKSTLSVNIAGNTVESLRKVVETTSTARVYENNLIGIAGQIGSEDLDKLEKTAVENLSNNMPYPCQLNENTVVELDTTKNILDANNFVNICKSLIDKIAKQNPKFLFSNKIQYTEYECDYSNSKNTSLKQKGNYFVCGLIAKDKNSANMMDITYSGVDKKYDEEAILKDINMIATNYFIPANIENGKYKVIIDTEEVLPLIYRHFVGEMYAHNTSLYNGKLNQKIFNENCSIVSDSNPNTTVGSKVFDAEGEINDDYKSYIVKNGVLTGLFTSKKTAKEYNLPLSKTGTAEYDGLPSAGVGDCILENSGKTLKELVGDDKAIFISICSGGDVTTSGDFATPVQLAFLYENGKIVGRLPDLKIYANVNDIFGDDFVGATEQSIFSFGQNQVFVSKLNVEK